MSRRGIAVTVAIIALLVMDAYGENIRQKLAPHLHHWDDSVVFGIDKLARDIGWRPRHSFRETVEKTYEWFTREQIAEQVTFDFTFEDELLEHCKE